MLPRMSAGSGRFCEHTMRVRILVHYNWRNGWFHWSEVKEFYFFTVTKKTLTIVPEPCTFSPLKWQNYRKKLLKVNVE